MPRRDDLNTILVLGSGPIKIGQAAEFDFSGSQAVRALREDGYEVILVNSNPATIQNDPEMADRVYIEPLLPDTVRKILEIERPDALLAGMGGQTALNIASELAHDGTLEKLGVELIGSDLDAIDKAEDRDLFNKVCESINLPISEAIACNTMDQVIKAAEEIGSWPILIRPAFTLGGLGGGTAFDLGQLVEIATLGLRNSRISQVLIEESILGWQELEYEVMRDGSDNATIVCTMENIDPMGVHTGESVVVAPLQSFSDSDHQELRDKALALIRELNIKGGCNVQFAYNQSTGEIRVIEVNPRVSRSSALASKATGYPIARMAAKIAVGYTLDELPNPITGEGTTAAFEPTLDYVVVKIPRWPFDKFRTADRTLGTSMKSTGEVMGFDEDFGMAFAKSQIAASNSLPTKGLAFISLKNGHKDEGVQLAKQLSKLNFKLCGTGGTEDYINKHGIKCKKVNKVNQGSPHIVDILNAKKIALVINTGGGNSEKQLSDAIALRRATLVNKVPYCTNMSTAQACLMGIRSLKTKEITVTSLQDI